MLVLFDVDGTLIRAGDPGHRDAFHQAFVEVYGVSATIDGIPLGGNLDRAIARTALRREGVDDATIDGGLDELMVAMGRRYDPSAVVPLAGAAASVAAASPGRVLGVLTGGAAGVARRKLVACGLDRLLTVGAYGCEAEERAELVRLASRRAGGVPMAGVVLVGDTPLDIDAARSAGCAVVAVATGRWTSDQLADAGPDALLDDLTDPLGFVAALDDLGRGRRAR